MARVTRSKNASTNDVVDILNHPGEPSTTGSNKRKRAGQSIPRPVGRPSKRRKSMEYANTVSGGQNTTPRATALESSEQSTESAPVSSKIGLESLKTSSSTRQRNSGAKTAHRTDIYTIPVSPASAPPATTRDSEVVENGFSLNNSTFDAVASTEVTVDTSKAPSQSTRSKVARTGSKPQKTSPIASQRPGRKVRIIKAKPFTSETEQDDSTEAITKESGPRQPLEHHLLSGGVPPTDSSYFGYQTPDKSSNTRTKRGKGTSGSAAALVPKQRAPAKKSQSSTKDTNNPRVSEQRREAGADLDEEVGAGEDDDNEGDADEDQEDKEGEAEEEENGNDSDVEEDEEDDGPEDSGNRGEAAISRNKVPAEQASGDRGDRSDEDSDTVSVEGGRQSQLPRPKASFDGAADLHDCGKDWKGVWRAAKKNRERSEPQTSPVRELRAAIEKFKEDFQPSVDEGSGRLDEMGLDLRASELDKIAVLIGNLRKTSSRSGEREKRLMEDIHRQAIPRTVELLRCILLTRFSSGTLSISSLEEMIMVLQSTRELCQRVRHWKTVPKPALETGIRKNTNQIKQSIQRIESAYKKALTVMQAAEDAAEAEMREIDFQEWQVKLKNAHRRDINEKRQKIGDWVQRDMAERQKRRPQELIPAIEPTDFLAQAEPEVFDVDELDLYASTPQPINREPTEEIPGPTRRNWRAEETLALLLLLQKYLGSDRYMKIQEVISEVARDLRKLGPDKFLQMADNSCFDLDLEGSADVLDDLGNIDVADIEQQAKWLKASLARKMESDVKARGKGEEWAWLLSV